MPRWDERIRVGAYLGRSKNHASNVALVLNLQHGHVNPQFHVAFDDNFETADSLRKGTEPIKWKWLASDKRECHLNDKKGNHRWHKTWTDSELERSTMFEVPKESNDDTTNNKSSAETTPSILLVRHVNVNINNNNEEINATIAENNDVTNNRSHDILPSDGFNSTVLPPLCTSTSNDAYQRPTRTNKRKNITFIGLPKHSPANIGTLGLMRSPRIAALQRKQLDPTLNHAGFVHASYASEEDVDPLKEHCAFKEAMKSPYKENVVKVMVHETNNNAFREHWGCIRKSDPPASLILRSTWTFRIKRNRSTGSTIKFKFRFCANGRTQELSINFHVTYTLVVKWNTIYACLTQAMLNEWCAIAIDFDQECTQVDCDADVYVHLPASFHGNNKDRHVIKLIKNPCGLRQGGYNFCEKL